jgi:hypothetical protein
VAGKRDANFRSGDLGETEALQLLRAVAFVAPVPREEDHGIDALVTIFREEGRSLHAENSFFCQVKTQSVKSIVYEADELKWLSGLRLPIFYVRPIRGESTIEIFSPHSAYVALIESEYDAIELSFEDENEDQPCLTNKRRFVSISPPILRVTAEDMANPDLRKSVYVILKAHIAVESLNREMRLARSFFFLKWRTNKQPHVVGRVTVVPHVAPNMVRRKSTKLVWM